MGGNQQGERATRWLIPLGWLLVLGAVAYALVVDEDRGIALVVVALGAAVLLLALSGKPTWPGVGLSERLLHRLPEPAWRIVMGCIGLAIIGLGLSELLR